MLCKYFNNIRYWIFLIFFGCISLVFGIVSASRIPDSEHNLNMLMGMFTGAGAAFIGVGTFKLIRMKIISPEKLKQEEINRKDERNIEILRAASTVSNLASTTLFAVMAFILVYLGYRTAAFVSIAALYVQAFVFMLAHRYYKGKM